LGQHRYKILIKENKRYFDLLLNAAALLVKRKEYEAAAAYLNDTANFAWDNCTGNYVNWQLEGLLNEIGEGIDDSQKIDTNKVTGSRLNVLHITTELYETGGHTKLLFNWVKNDTANDHTIVTTRQAQEQLPMKNIISSGLDASQFITLGHIPSFIEKAKQLRALVRQYDCVILHIHNYDVVPVIALSGNNLPPVAFLNHADHIFWVGASVSDLVLQIRDANIKLDAARRNLDHQYFLPIPVPGDDIQVKYEEVRKELNIAAEQIMLLSTGSEYKYIPTKKYNFFEHSINVLDKCPQAVLYIAGIYPDSKLAIKYAHKQIVYLGPVYDLYRYETACDIYVEGYPFPSFTALLQPAKKGKPVQLMYEPMPVVVFFNDNTPGFIYPQEAEWESELYKLVTDKQAREYLAEEQKAHIAEFYAHDKWKLRLSVMYKELLGLKHRAAKHDSTPFLTGDNEWYLASIGGKATGFSFFLPGEQPRDLKVYNFLLTMKRTNYVHMARNLANKYFPKKSKGQ